MQKNRRAKTKYPALKPELNLKTRYELIDYDYVDKLDDSNKGWLNKFTEEYVNASLDRINYNNNIHNTKELKQDCDRRNNARNRDMLTRAKACGSHVSIDELKLNKKEILFDKEQRLLDVIDDLTDNLEDTSS
jgi:hypothetical protein